MPVASATTFFSAPPTSAPITSWFVYSRNTPRARALWIAVATEMSSVATTLAAAWPDMISRARFGPLDATAGRPGNTSPITCVIRSNVPDSNPLLRLMIGIHGCT